jgi:MFS family permease
VQAALVGRLTPRLGEKRLALASLLGNATGSLAIVAAPALWLLYPLVFVQSAVTGFIWSATGTLAAGYVSEREQGQLAGVNGALAGLMSMLGPLAAGAVFDGVGPAAPYWLSVAAMLAGALLLLGWVRAAAPAPARAAAEA